MGQPFRVLVAGPRQFADYRLLARTLDALLARRLAPETAPTDWTGPRGPGRKHGVLVAGADAVVVFNDGRDRDARDVLGRAVKLHKPLRVVRVPFVPSGRAAPSRW